MPFLYALALLLFALVQPTPATPPPKREVASEQAEKAEKGEPVPAAANTRWEKERWKN